MSDQRFLDSNDSPYSLDEQRVALLLDTLNNTNGVITYFRIVTDSDLYIFRTNSDTTLDNVIRRVNSMLENERSSKTLRPNYSDGYVLVDRDTCLCEIDSSIRKQLESEVLDYCMQNGDKVIVGDYEFVFPQINWKNFPKTYFTLIKSNNENQLVFFETAKCYEVFKLLCLEGGYITKGVVERHGMNAKQLHLTIKKINENMPYMQFRIAQPTGDTNFGYCLGGNPKFKQHVIQRKLYEYSPNLRVRYKSDSSLGITFVKSFDANADLYLIDGACFNKKVYWDFSRTMNHLAIFYFDTHSLAIEIGENQYKLLREWKDSRLEDNGRSAFREKYSAQYINSMLGTFAKRLKELAFEIGFTVRWARLAEDMPSIFVKAKHFEEQ